MDESAPEAEKQELLSVWKHERNSFRSLEAGISFWQVFYWGEAAPEILRNILLILFALYANKPLPKSF